MLLSLEHEENDSYSVVKQLGNYKRQTRNIIEVTFVVDWDNFSSQIEELINAFNLPATVDVDFFFTTNKIGSG